TITLYKPPIGRVFCLLDYSLTFLLLETLLHYHSLITRVSIKSTILIYIFNIMPQKAEKGKGNKVKETENIKGKRKPNVQGLQNAPECVRHHVPILFSVFNRVNSKKAYEWALAFE